MASSSEEPGNSLPWKSVRRPKHITGIVEPVGDAGQLPDLVGGEELRLVDEDAIDLADLLMCVADALEEIVIGAR